jgi:hypothetical protein
MRRRGLIVILALTLTGCARHDQATATWPSPSLPPPPLAPPRAFFPYAHYELLEERIAELRFNSIPLADALDELARKGNVRIEVEWAALQAAGIGRDRTVTTRAHDVKLKKALDIVLSNADANAWALDWYGDGDVLRVTTAPRATAATSYDKTYPVADVLLSRAGQIRPEELKDEFLALVREAVDPESWVANGGVAGRLHFNGETLWVLQTDKNHRRIDTLLSNLRDPSWLRR